MLSLFPNVFHKGDCPEQPLSIIIQNTLVRSKLTLFDIFNLSVVSKDIHTLCVQPDLILEKVPAPIHLGSRSTALARIKQLIIDSSTLNDFHFTLFNKGVHPPYDAQVYHLPHVSLIINSNDFK